MPLNINSDEMLITDDKGNEHVMKILFTYDNEERHKSYVFLFEKDDEENVQELLNQISMEFENYEFEMIEEYQNYGKIAYIFATLDFQCLDETIKKELKEFYEKYDIGGFKYYEQW